jgi:prepilin-type N-terminal cleavage/methylation domain-containing protein
MIHNTLKSSHSGFSVVELLIAMVIAGISLGAIYSVFASVQKTSTSNEVNARVMQSLRTCIGFMESDIRMAGLDRFGTAGAGIEVATATNLRLTADRSGPGGIMDGTINTADLTDDLQEQDLERITYSYDAAGKRLRQCLSEGTTDAWETVAENVDNFGFRYFDANNNLIAFPILDNTLIRFVEVSITVQQPAGMAIPVSRTITKRIFCRNLAMG